MKQPQAPSRTAPSPQKLTRMQRLEQWLQTVWYQGHQPAWPVRLILDTTASVFSALRGVTGQSRKARQARQAKPMGRPPVLVVGNLIAGGAGKTPIVQAVCQSLTARGHRVGILTRGYKRKGTAPLLLMPGETPDVAACGDEPAWLLQQTGCPVAVGADRSAALQALLLRCPDLSLVVSDDGLQHHRLPRSLEWVIFDERLAGNGKLLPAGPLREPLCRLREVDAVLCSALPPSTLSAALHLMPKPTPAATPTSTSNREQDQASSHVRETGQNPGVFQPLLSLTHFEHLASGEKMTTAQALSAWQNRRVEAFTGLANPEKFFKALRAEGFELEKARALPDHYDYPSDFCRSLNGDIALTTGKDAVKLNSDPRVWVAQIEVKLPPELVQQLEAEIGRSSH